MSDGWKWIVSITLDLVISLEMKSCANIMRIELLTRRIDALEQKAKP